MTGLSLVVPDDPTPADREAILTPLRAYNTAAAGDSNGRQLAILVQDAHGATTGGLWGRISHEWLFVELLVVPETHRGQGLGRTVMERAEAIAREAGCTGIWLDTFEFQAPGFYAKLGFTMFGSLPDYPVGFSRYFLMKRI